MSCTRVIKVRTLKVITNISAAVAAAAAATAAAAAVAAAAGGEGGEFRRGEGSRYGVLELKFSKILIL